MHRALCAVVLLGLVGVSVLYAQDAPKSEKAPGIGVFAGFSYANYELLSITSNISSGSGSSSFGGSSSSTLILSPQHESARLGLYGWNAAISADLNPWFSLVTDFSGIYSNGSTSITQTFLVTCFDSGTGTCTGTETETVQIAAGNPRIYNFLFGPQFAYPHGKVKPFARFLVGGSHKSVATSEIITLTENGSTVTIPPVSSLASSLPSNQFAMAFGGGADYRFRPNLAWRTTVDYLTGQGTGQNHVRVSSGILWQAGK